MKGDLIYKLLAFWIGSAVVIVVGLMAKDTAVLFVVAAWLVPGTVALVRGQK